jgi:hypothetical protein
MAADVAGLVVINHQALYRKRTWFFAYCIGFYQQDGVPPLSATHQFCFFLLFVACVLAPVQVLSKLSRVLGVTLRKNPTK